MPAARRAVRPQSPGETARLLAAIEIVSPLVMLAEFPAVVLRALSGLMRWSALSYNEVDPVGQRAVFLVEPADLASAGMADRFQRHAGEHPLIRHYARTGDRSAHAISDLASAAELHRTALYREVYGPLGVEDQLSVQLATRPPHVVGVVVSRSRRGFSPTDRRLLNALLPYLDAAYANAHRHTHLYVALEGLGIALEDEQRGVGIVGDDGRWQRLTPPARRLVREYFGGTAASATEGGEAPAALVAWVRRQRGSSAAAVGAPLVVERPPLRLAVHCMPAPGAPDVVLLEEQRLDAHGDPLMALGLSARQAELLRLVSAGHPNAEIARQLGLRVGTVKKHVEHILQRLRVRNRTEASKVALHALNGR